MNGEPRDALVVDTADEPLHRWSAGSDPRLGLVVLWCKYAPRGRGAFPRWIGRTLARRARLAIRTAGGALLAVDPFSFDVYAQIARDRGYWQPEVLSVCALLLRPGQVFHDIGANVGYFAIELAHRFRDQIRVHAFEPQARLACHISISASLTGLRGVAVHPVMIGRTAGQAVLHLAAHSGHASAVPRDRRCRPLVCPMRTIDDLVADRSIEAPDLIKIDVEGGELDVFRGASRTLQDRRPVIVFECNQNIWRFGHSRRELFKCLTSLADFRLFGLASKGWTEFSATGTDPGSTEILELPPHVDAPFERTLGGGSGSLEARRPGA